MAEPSPEANMVMDELRAAVRNIDAATERLVRALEHGEAFVRGERRAPRITTMATPPAGGFFQTPATGGATSIRE